MILNDRTGSALIALVRDLRPEWDAPGIAAALRKADTGERSLVEITVATIRCADDRAANTPGALGTGGAYWRGAVGETGTTTAREFTHCHEHPGHRATTCPLCEKARTRATPEAIAAARAEGRRLAAEARYDRYQPTEDAS